MAKYGARGGYWAPFADKFEDADATKLPSYGAAKTIGQLNKVNDSINFIEGSLSGDDQIVLAEKHFKDGTVNIESVFLPVADAAAMFGAATDTESGLSHGEDDNPPYIGYGFLTHHVGKTGKHFQVVFYPKLRAFPASEDFETRGDNLTFATDKLQLIMYSPACRKFKIVKDFDTESAAANYLAGLFAGTSVAPGLQAQQA